jgi:hypothetical protein
VTFCFGERMQTLELEKSGSRKLDPSRPAANADSLWISSNFILQQLQTTLQDTQLNGE